MNKRICDAWLLARYLHRDQRRKYTGNHYIDHLAEVAALTSIFTNGDEDAIIAAWLHDCIEDQGYELEKIFDHFGYRVCYLVDRLTEIRIPGQTRKERHIVYNKQLLESDKTVQLIKAADIISNIKSVVERDIAFGEVYIKECREKFNHLTKLPLDVILLMQTAFSDATASLDEKRLQEALKNMEKQ